MVDCGTNRYRAVESLNERRRRQTRNEIAAAATALFIENGYDATTVEAVAEAAGVSRRTAYRHFPLKEDLVFVHGLIWLEHFDELATERQADESTRSFLRRAVIGVSESIQEAGDQVLPAWQLAQENEFLRSRLGRFQEHWMLRYGAIVHADLAHRPDGHFAAAVVAGTLVGVTTALVGLWAAGQPEADLRQLTVDALDQIDSIWPDETRTAPEA